MRILVVNDLLQGGGVEKLMYDMVMHLHKNHEITILTDKRDFEFENIYPSDVGYMYQMERDYPKGKNKIERNTKNNCEKVLTKVICSYIINKS